jgi:hypothetical protein
MMYISSIESGSSGFLLCFSSLSYEMPVCCSIKLRASSRLSPMLAEQSFLMTMVLSSLKTDTKVDWKSSELTVSLEHRSGRPMSLTEELYSA